MDNISKSRRSRCPNYETNELMLAIEQMLIKNLNASITGHGQMTQDKYEADFDAVIDGKNII